MQKPHPRCRLHIRPLAVVMGGGMFLWSLLHRTAPIRSLAVTWGAMALAALLHEGGHWMVARACHVRVSRVTLDLFGARMHLEGLTSYRQELLIAAGGPAMNLLSLAVGLPFWLYRAGPWHETLGLFLMASCGFMMINLLPVGTLDGGRILQCLLADVCGDVVAHGVKSAITVLCLLLFWLLATYVLLMSGRMLSLFVFALCLLVREIGAGEVP